MDSLSLLSASIPTALCLSFLFFLFRLLRRPTLPSGIPPGNRGWPLIGEMLGFLKPHHPSSPGPFLLDRCHRYGKVFRSHIFGHDTIVSCSSELNAFIMQNEEKLFRASYPKSMYGILWPLSSLITAGAVHKRQRGVIVGFVRSTTSTPEFLHYVEEQSKAMMDSWREKTVVHFCPEAQMLAFNVIVKHALGIDAGEPIAAKMLGEFLNFMKGFVSLPINIPGTAFYKAVKARKRLQVCISEMICERRKVVEGGGGGGEGEFLEGLLLKVFKEEEIISVVLDLLLGGYETTSSLLALLLYFLDRTPSALHELREEHMGIRKRKGEGFLDMEDYRGMKFTQNVISETLRCGNIVKLLHREAVADIRFKEYFIPSGWKVLPIFTAVHMDPSIHENPDEFNPWRWKEDTVAGKKVTPFGGGVRHCPGRELARIETALFLHHLVLNYRWEVGQGDMPLAHPYVEFERGLMIKIKRIDTHTT